MFHWHPRRPAERSIAFLLASLTVLGLRGAAQTSPSPNSRPAAPSSVRLYILDGGILESDPGRYRLTKEDVGTTQLSVAAYLVVHPKGVLLWDTGAISDGDWTPTGKAVQQRLDRPLRQGLADRPAGHHAPQENCRRP